MQLLNRLKAWFSPGPAEPGPMAELSVLLGLLVEAAMADHLLSQAEKDRLLQWLHARGVSEQEAEQLLRFAVAEQQESTSMHPMTHWVVKNLDRQRRVELMRELWRVVFADGHMDPWEEALMRRLCDLIHLPHSVYIQTKLAAEEERG